MNADKFADFLKIRKAYQLKKVVRATSNFYYDDKDDVHYERKETVAEHVYSLMRLADYFMDTEEEFTQLNRILVHEYILYHDDPEIITGDVEIANVEGRCGKEEREEEAVKVLFPQYPQVMGEKLRSKFAAFEAKTDLESKFVNGVDKLDSMVHELDYPADWGPKGYSEENVRSWHGKAVEYSPTLSAYFEAIISYLSENGYFNKEQ